MLLCALALSVALAPFQDVDLDRKVTFSDQGTAVPKLVEELSQAAHVPLFAPKAFQTDIIVIRVAGAPLKEIMAKIADMTAADWHKKGSGYELVRSRAKLAAEEQAEYAREVAMFQKAIDAQKKKVAALEPWNETTARAVAVALGDAQKTQSTSVSRYDSGVWQRLQAIDARAPGGRAITRVLSVLHAKDLAGIPFDYKVVYSDQPTRMQRPLPPGVAPLLKDLVAEQNVWADVAGTMYSEPQGGYYSAAMWMRKPFAGRMGKVLLMVSKARFSGNISANVELVASDPKGRVIIRGNQQLTSFAMDDFNKRPKPEPGEQPIPPSPLAEATKNMYEGSRDGRARSTMPKALVDALANPEANEPLALATGDMLVKLAEIKKINLIASLPDETFTLGAYMGMQKITPSMLLAAMRYSPIELTATDDWLVLTTKAPSSNRAERIDRAALGNYLRQIAKKGRVSLDELATYATMIKGEIYNSIGFMIAQLITPRNDTQYFEANILRFYGLLDLNQRQALAKGGRINLNNLSGAQADALNKMIFGASTDLMPKGGPNGTFTQDDWDLFYNGIGKEPTELFANGIPGSSILKTDDRSDKVLVAPPYELANGLSYGSRAMGPDEVAQQLYARERPGLFPWVDEDSGFEQRKFTFGERRALTFQFEFGELAVMHKALQDLVYDFTEGVGYDQLPDDFKKKVQARLEEMRKSYKDIKPGQLGGSTTGTTTPPPPRR